MKTKSFFKWLCLVSILAVPWIFIGAANVNSKNIEPPPPGFKLTGPAVVGKLTLYSDGTANFVGHCKGDTFYIDAEHAFSNAGSMTKEDLDGLIIPADYFQTEAAVCFSHLDFPPPSLIIQAVTGITNNPANSTVADVVLLGLVMR